MAYALLGFFVLLVIGQGVLIWKSSQNWRWYQMVPLVVTLILAIVFLYPTAGSLKSRAAWHKLKQDLDKQIEQVQREQQELRWGDPNDIYAADAVLPLSQELAKLTGEAGRRWRGLQMTQANLNASPASVVLTQPAEQPAVDGLPPDEDEKAAPAGDPIPLIPAELVVYGFAERPMPGVDSPVPIFYLGEFRVTAATPNQVTLTPTGELMPAQRNAIANREAVQWTIFELLPLDGHEAFLAEGSKPDDANILGRVDEQAVTQIFGNSLTAATLASYLQNGRRSQPDDPPLTRWVRVEFTKDHSIPVDSPDQRSALDGGYFDGSGRAVDSRLQQGNEGSVKFQKGQELVVKEEAADALLNEGVVTKKDGYFLRPLNDYRFVLRRIRLRLAELEQRTVELNFEQNVLQRAITATDNMSVVYQEDKNKLEQDLAQTEIERRALTDYNDQLQTSVKETRQRLVSLYRSNQQLEEQLEAIHLAIERNVNSLTTTQ